MQKAASKLDQIRVAINRDFAERPLDASALKPQQERDIGLSRQSRQTGDVASDLNFFALKAMLSLMKNETSDAYSSAIQADALLSDKSLEPTAFFTFPAYMVR